MGLSGKKEKLNSKKKNIQINWMESLVLYSIKMCPNNSNRFSQKCAALNCFTVYSLNSQRQFNRYEYLSALLSYTGYYYALISAIKDTDASVK